MDKKQHRMSYKCPGHFFVLVAQPNKTDKVLKVFNFCVFLPIWMKFGIGANMGLQTTWKEFERPTTFS